jgi:hypothetical protein
MEFEFGRIAWCMDTGGMWDFSAVIFFFYFVAPEGLGAPTPSWGTGSHTGAVSICRQQKTGIYCGIRWSARLVDDGSFGVGGLPSPMAWLMVAIDTIRWPLFSLSPPEDKQIIIPSTKTRFRFKLQRELTTWGCIL